MRRSFLPRAEQIERAVRDRIEQGRYASGEYLPPERLLAAQFNVSRPTLRKALAPLARDGWIENIAGKGTRVLPREAGIAGGWKVIALVVPDITSRFFVEVTEAIESTALQRGYQILLCSSRRQVEREDLHLHQLVKRRVEGVILAHDRYRTFPQALEQVERAGIPCVCMFSAPERSRFDTVSLNEEDGVKQALRYLFSLGHRRIGFCRPLAAPEIHPRETAWRAAMAREGLKLPDHFTIPFEALADTAAMTGLLKARSRPSALLAGNDHAALLVVKQLQRLGMATPGGMSVVGYDNLAFTEHLPVPLTTVAQPVREMGRRAAEMLLDRVEMGVRGPARHEVFAPHLVVRESCAAVG